MRQRYYAFDVHVWSMQFCCENRRTESDFEVALSNSLIDISSDELRFIWCTWRYTDLKNRVDWMKAVQVFAAMRRLETSQCGWWLHGFPIFSLSCILTCCCCCVRHTHLWKIAPWRKFRGDLLIVGTPVLLWWGDLVRRFGSNPPRSPTNNWYTP